MKKIGNLKFETFPLSKCNIKAAETMSVYPLQDDLAVCPICGKELHKNFVLATQISASECIKLNGAACLSCSAFFTKSSKLVNWLKIKKYNKGIPKILDTYNIKVNMSKHQRTFNSSESIFRQFSLMSEADVKTIFVTYDLKEENAENQILHYIDPLSHLLLKAEKENNRQIPINGADYTIVQILKKPIEDDEIRADVISAIEDDIVYSDKLPPFSSETTVYVYRGHLRCHSLHHTEEVRLILQDASYDFRFYAEYCHECQKYLMKYDDYNTFLEKYALFPSKVVMIGNSHFFDEYGRAEKSPLKLNGYSVSVDAGLSSEERQDRLAFIVDHGILSKRKALDYLNRFISTNKNNERFQAAILKWQEDKEFLLNYSERAVPLILIGKIERLKK